MRGLVAFGLLSLLAGSELRAQEPLVAPLAGGPFARGRALLADGRYLDAAGTFREYLSSEGLGRYTVPVAVYCDVSNLGAHLQRSGNPSELFVLARSVGGRVCLGLFWGLFASRSGADAAIARLPSSLRTLGQRGEAVASLLGPGAPAAARPTPPPLPPPSRAEATPPAVTPVAPEPLRAPERPIAAPPAITPSVATPQPEPVSGPPAAAEPASPPQPALPSQSVPATRAPRAEIGLAYSYLWNDGIGQIQIQTDGAAAPLGLRGRFPLGGVLSASLNLTERVGIVAELSEHHSSQNVLGSAVRFDMDLLGLRGGVRYSDRENAFVTPYAQALFGVARFKAAALGASGDERRFSIQPGVGILFRASDRVRVDVGGDYRFVFTEPDYVALNHKTTEFRLRAGVVLHVGMR